MTQTSTAGWIATIEETHSWGDCEKRDGHCHCSIAIAALRAGEARTCRHCGHVEVPATDAELMRQQHVKCPGCSYSVYHCHCDPLTTS